MLSAFFKSFSSLNSSSLHGGFDRKHILVFLNHIQLHSRHNTKLGESLFSPSRTHIRNEKDNATRVAITQFQNQHYQRHQQTVNKTQLGYPVLPVCSLSPPQNRTEIQIKIKVHHLRK